jgi:predicted dehydrogenase
MAAQVLRFFPAYLPLIEGVQQGRFGRVLHATFRRRCAAPPWSPWMADKSKSGGGVFDLLIHDIDMALVLFGKPDAVSAWGHEDLPNGIDVVTAQLHYPGIPSVTITGGWHHKKSYPFSMEYTVVGEAGAMEYSSAGREPAWYALDGSETKLDLPAIDGYRAEIEYFLDCCRHNRAPERCSPESSAAAVKLARLIDEARAKKGETVPCIL